MATANQFIQRLTVIWLLLLAFAHLSSGADLQFMAVGSDHLFWRRLNIPVFDFFHATLHVGFKQDECDETADPADCELTFARQLIEPLVDACDESRKERDDNASKMPLLDQHESKTVTLKSMGRRGRLLDDELGLDLGVYNVHTVSKSVSKLYDATANLNADVKQLNSEIGDLSGQMANVTGSVRHALEFRDLVNGVSEFNRAIRRGEISKKAIELWTGLKFNYSIDLSLSGRPVCHFNADTRVLTLSARIAKHNPQLSLYAPDHFTLFNNVGCSITFQPKVMLRNRATSEFCAVDADLNRVKKNGYFLMNKPCSATNDATTFKRDCSSNGKQTSKSQVKRFANHYRVYCYHSSIVINDTIYKCPNEIFRVPLNVSFKIDGALYAPDRALDIDLDAQPDSLRLYDSIRFVNPVQARLHTNETAKIIDDFRTESTFFDDLAQTWEDSLDSIEAFIHKYLRYFLLAFVAFIALSLLCCYLWCIRRRKAQRRSIRSYV